MPVWFIFSVFILAAFSGGCASATDERFDLLASEIRAQEVRLSMLEDTVTSLAVPVSQVASGGMPPSLAGHPQGGQAEKTAQPGPGKASSYRSTPGVLPAVGPANALVSPKAGGGQAAEQRYQQALTTLEAGRPQAALGLFQEFARTYPGHPLMPNALYWIGECLYSQKQYDAAILAFKDVVAQFPAHAKAAAAMLKAGYSYALLRDAPNARFYLEMLIKDYPSSAPANLARARLATL